ncbi:MAG: pyruvate formate lyase family protein [Candidatus Bathyarchaeota archaeon]|jgi:formate C-acetyltransferase
MEESRTEKLRRNLSHKTHTPTEIERPTIFTRPGLQEEPLAIRKAKALALMLEKVPVHIYPGELIVGTPFRETPIEEGDSYLRSILPESPSGEGYITGAHGRIELGLASEPYDPVIQGLEGYGTSTKWGIFPHYATEEEIAEARRIGLDENSNPGHLQAGHARVVGYGLTGLKEMAEGRLHEIDPSNPKGEKQEAFLRSVIIALEAAQEFSLRYSGLASAMAEEESDPIRAGELREISEVCKRIAERPPSSFWEALQLHWFTHLINHTQGAHQMGRFDQYMWSFLEEDLKARVLTREEALELLECLWFKYASYTDLDADNLQNLILSGQTPDGRDATNPLSYMCLDITDRLDLIDPKVSVRVHRETPEGFLRKICEIIAKGRYQPGVYNDEAIIPALVGAGIPLEDARDYTNDGCSEILIQGKTNPWAYEARVRLLSCLERVTERIMELDTFSELMDALEDEIGIAVSMAVAGCNILQAGVPRISPNPFVSATVEGCIEKALDITEGGAVYNTSAVCASGVADAADSLTALKKFVFEKDAVRKEDLLQALSHDFKGDERLRLMLLNRAPKFGNDNDYVDSIATGLVETLASEVTKHRNPRGGNYILGLFSYGMYIGHGMMTAATPDGRKAGEGISPNFSPAPGRDRKGPFAVLKSTTKVDQSLTPNGNALDITIHPSVLRGPKGVEKMMAFIMAMVELGGMQVQFNVVDTEVLRAAQAEPEKYAYLTVRLWGFPAYFVRLPREFQDHLIARTSHSL